MRSTFGSGAITVDMKTGAVEALIRQARSKEEARSNLEKGYAEAVDHGADHDGIVPSSVPNVLEQGVVYWEDEMAILVTTNGGEISVDRFNDVIEEKMKWRIGIKSRSGDYGAPYVPGSSPLLEAEMLQLLAEAQAGESASKSPHPLVQFFGALILLVLPLVIIVYVAFQL